MIYKVRKEVRELRALQNNHGRSNATGKGLDLLKQFVVLLGKAEGLRGRQCVQWRPSPSPMGFEKERDFSFCEGLVNIGWKNDKKIERLAFGRPLQSLV